MLYYVPLERYAERYTWQLAAPDTGWNERHWLAAGIPFKRIDGTEYGPTIRTGVALDAGARTRHCFIQVEKLINLEYQPGDVIYFDDFWHPGLEQLVYTLRLGNRHVPRMFCNLWAQSVDRFDFTAPFAKWMGPIEQGYGKIYDGIFCATPKLRDLVLAGGIGTKKTVHAVGHPWSTAEVMGRMELVGFDKVKRGKNVAFASRLDWEKAPDFMLAVADRVLLRDASVTWTILSGNSLRSNLPGVPERVRNMAERYPGRFILKTNNSKSDYYRELMGSRVLFASSLQDWISYVLLEGITAGCYPVFPDFRSFPEVLGPEFLYPFPHHQAETCQVRGEDAYAAAEMVLDRINREPLHTPEAAENRRWMVRRFDSTWQRMAAVMGLWKGEVYDPFDH
jgi:glycosyltransferase involved in cell wall biosynthesis